MRCQFRIQGMNTFQNQNCIIFYFQFITFIFLFAKREIKTGQFHLLEDQ